MLLAGEVLRRRAPAHVEDDGTGDVAGEVAAAAAGGADGAVTTTTTRRTRRLTTLSYREGFVIGFFQTFALLAGISRSGISMVGGLARGLSHRDAARFSFLLATPVILAAGALKIPDLTGPLGSGIRGQVLFGSLLSGIGAYLSVRFLTRYLANRSLRPFGAYCIAAGAAALAVFAIR